MRLWTKIKLALLAGLTVTMMWHWRVVEADAYIREKSDGIPWAIVPGDALATPSGAEKAPMVEPVPSGHWIDMGTFKTTGYCNCRKCAGKWAGGPTKSGAMPVAGETVAVDPGVIPLGSMVMIDGVIRWAHDTGVRGKHIDVYYDSHSVAWSHGVKRQHVFVWKEE